MLASLEQAVRKPVSRTNELDSSGYHTLSRTREKGPKGRWLAPQEIIRDPTEVTSILNAF